MESLSVTFLSSPFRSNISSSLTTRTYKNIKNTNIDQKHKQEFIHGECNLKLQIHFWSNVGLSFKRKKAQPALSTREHAHTYDVRFLGR